MGRPEVWEDQWGTFRHRLSEPAWTVHSTLLQIPPGEGAWGSRRSGRDLWDDQVLVHTSSFAIRFCVLFCLFLCLFGSGWPSMTGFPSVLLPFSRFQLPLGRGCHSLYMAAVCVYSAIMKFTSPHPLDGNSSSTRACQSGPLLFFQYGPSLNLECLFKGEKENIKGIQIFVLFRGILVALGEIFSLVLTYV